MPDWSGMTTRKVNPTEQMKKITCWMTRPGKETRGEKPWRGRMEKRFLLLFPKPVLVAKCIFHFNPIKKTCEILTCLLHSEHNAPCGI